MRVLEHALDDLVEGPKMSAAKITTPVGMRLQSRLADKTARTAVVGLGYVGLPLLVEFAKSGYEAIGFDLDARKIAEVTAGRSYIADVPNSDVSALTQAGRLRATADFTELGNVDTVNICVPTPLRKTKDPDMSYVVSA